VQGVVLCPSPIYSSHPNSRLVKRRRVPTEAEQCGCTIFPELARRAANGSHSVAPSARNSVLRSSNVKTANGVEPVVAIEDPEKAAGLLAS